MFQISPDMNIETLLAHACESLASASVLASDFATYLSGSQRSTALAIAQVVMLADLAVNRALDIVDPQG
jgi:TRAP-type C4-dicarboxylate transport system permease large subunit